MEQELYAFWKYDRFPYCLWGKFSKVKNDLVYVDSYQGYCRPFKISDEEYAGKLMYKLTELAAERDRELELVRQKYEEKLDELITIPGVNS